MTFGPRMSAVRAVAAIPTIEDPLLREFKKLELSVAEREIEAERVERERRAALVDVQAVMKPYLHEAYQAGFASGLMAADLPFRDCPS